MDRRTYPRLQIEVEGLFILQNENIMPRDFEGLVIDISEGGLQLSIDYNKYSQALDDIKEGDVIHVSIPDEYELFGEERFDIVTGNAKIVRKTVDNNNIILGCKFLTRTSELEQYLIDRRTSFYMNNL